MNYRDIILKLLRKRQNVSIVEDIVLADFANADDPKAAFEKWCEFNHIHIERNPGERSVILSKIPKKEEE